MEVLFFLMMRQRLCFPVTQYLLKIFSRPRKRKELLVKEDLRITKEYCFFDGELRKLLELQVQIISEG